MPSGSTQCSCRIHAGKATRIEAINVNQRKEKKGPMNIRKRGVMKGEEAEESWGPGERWGWGSGTASGADGWISADGDRGPEKRKRDGGHSEESTVSCLSTPLPSRAPAQSKKLENTPQLCFSFLLVPLLLESGDRSQGRLDFNRRPVPGASTSAMTARAPARTPMGTQT